MIVSGLLFVVSLAGATGFAAAIGYIVGRVRGRRAMWRDLVVNRDLGHLALEQLARAHGAKLELVQVPGA